MKMLKGILLGICTSVFVVSLIFIFASWSGNLEENLITGNVIGEPGLVRWSFVSLIFSAIGAMAVVLFIVRDGGEGLGFDFEVESEGVERHHERLGDAYTHILRMVRSGWSDEDIMDGIARQLEAVDQLKGFDELHYRIDPDQSHPVINRMTAHQRNNLRGGMRKYGEKKKG